jgi:hypothetical protein
MTCARHVGDPDEIGLLCPLCGQDAAGGVLGCLDCFGHAASNYASHAFIKHSEQLDRFVAARRAEAN